MVLMQAVILAVYGFGLVTLMGRSFSKEDVPIPESLIAYLPLLPGFLNSYYIILLIN